MNIKTDGECEWWCEDYPDVWGDCGMWESSCGVAYQFTNGGVTENSHIYCHKCGKKIVLREARPEKKKKRDLHDRYH